MSLNEILDTLTLRAGFNTNAVILGTTLLGMAAGAFLISTSLGYAARSMPVLMLGADLTGIAGVVCIHLTLAHSGLKEDAAIGIVLSVLFGIDIVLLIGGPDIRLGHRSGDQSFHLRAGQAHDPIRYGAQKYLSA